MAGAGTRAGLVIEAVRYLGPDVDPQVVERLRSQLSPREKKDLCDHLYAAPAWVRPILARVART